jgi:hypothetical protein
MLPHSLIEPHIRKKETAVQPRRKLQSNCHAKKGAGKILQLICLQRGRQSRLRVEFRIAGRPEPTWWFSANHGLHFPLSMYRGRLFLWRAELDWCQPAFTVKARERWISHSSAWLVRRGTGAPGEIRTPDLLLRRQPLYPAELRARTGMYSLHGPGKRLQEGGEFLSSDRAGRHHHHRRGCRDLRDRAHHHRRLRHRCCAQSWAELRSR